MEKLWHNNTLIGIVVSELQEGSVPITDKQESLQLVGLRHPKGACLKAHYHAATEVRAMHVQESLVVLRGRIKLDVYGPAPECPLVRTIELRTGEAFIMLQGGYGITMLEDGELLEYKNGPFQNDKVFI